MTLERKDVRLKLDHDMHAAAKALGEAQGMEIAEWCENVLVGIIKKRVHESIVVVSALTDSGAIGTFKDAQGGPRNG